MSNQAVAIMKPESDLGITPAQAKVDAIAKLTMKAYDKASTLKLTKDELTAMARPFPDEAFRAGAGGNPDAIYIEHAYLRDRLNEVFGVGQWAIIPRSRWGEDFKTQNGDDATRIYVEAMLVIRGCFVAESVGDMVYYKNNATQNYGDAVEGAKSCALRRCAKEIGIGLDAWKKKFCEGWKERNGRNKQLGRAVQKEQEQKKQTPAVICEMFFENYTYKNVQDKPAWICLFASDSGSTIKCSTFDQKLAESFDSLKGEEVTISYRPWGKDAAKLQLLSVSPRNV